MTNVVIVVIIKQNMDKSLLKELLEKQNLFLFEANKSLDSKVNIWASFFGVSMAIIIGNFQNLFFKDLLFTISSIFLLLSIACLLILLFIKRMIHPPSLDKVFAIKGKEIIFLEYSQDQYLEDLAWAVRKNSKDHKERSWWVKNVLRVSVLVYILLVVSLLI